MNIEVGMKCRQIKPLEQYGFNYVGQEFKVDSLNENVIMCKNNFMGFGIDSNEFLNYFELIQPINKVEIHDNVKVIRNNMATIVILSDGTKGVSKCLPNDVYDAQRGYDIAYLKAQIKSSQKRLKKLCK